MVAGGFKEDVHPQVERLVRSFHRWMTFDAGPTWQMHGWHNERCEGIVLVHPKNPFELESMAIAMIKSQLFCQVQVSVDGRGGAERGAECKVRVERLSLFDFPEHPSVSQVIPKLRAFFTSYLTIKNPNATVSVAAISEDNFSFLIRANGLRNTVVKGGKYWEDMEIELRIYPRLGAEEQGLVVDFDVSGKYASGIDVKPPPLKYKYLLGDHPDEVQDWTEQLGAAFRQYFERASKSIQ